MLERINKEISSAINIEELKQFANITGNTRDAELQVILNSAISKVEDIADVSLSANTFLYSSNYPTKIVKLYRLPIAEVIEVRDNRSGSLIDYTLSLDKSLVVFTEEACPYIQYKTKPVGDATFDYLKQIVYEVASAYYDGMTDNAKLNDIYRKIPKSLC